MKKFHSAISCLIVTGLFALTCEGAKALRLADQLTPGSTIEFYLTLDGSKEKAKDLEYDIYGCGEDPAKCELIFKNRQGSFEAKNLGSKDIFFEFRHNGNATDWRQVIRRPDGRLSDTGLVNVKRPALPKSGSPEYQSPGIFETLTNDYYRIPDVISSVGVDLYALVYTDLYVENNPNGFLDGNWSVGNSLGNLNVSIVNGQVNGIHGIWWATGEWLPSFDINGMVTFSHTGILYNSVPQDVLISQHYQVPAPLPIMGLLITWSMKRRIRDKMHKKEGA